jgi:hypothetical protein
VKSLLAAFIILLLIHLLAGIGFVGWLGATDRVNGERLQRVVQTFTPTLEEEAESRAAAEAAAEQAAATRDQLMRLNSVANGPQTLEDRLAANFEADEFELHRLERLHAETDAIRRRLEQDKTLIAKQLAELEARQAEFAELVAERTQAMENEDFQRAVKTLEQLPAQQAKEMVQQYLAQQKLEEVVNYLAAMQLRKSAAVLKAFKTPEEIGQAALLLEQLRTRGQDPFTDSQVADNAGRERPEL